MAVDRFYPKWGRTDGKFRGRTTPGYLCENFLLFVCIWRRLLLKFKRYLLFSAAFSLPGPSSHTQPGDKMNPIETMQAYKLMCKRIITRPDFDGVVCAVLLKEALGHEISVVWAQPGQLQHGELAVEPQDVVANLPLSGQVALWFDHHVSNEVEHPFNGLFRIAPSAAGLVYEYFKDRLDGRFDELVRQADKIDAAQLTLDEIKHPERYPYVLLSMTIYTRQASDNAYCDLLVRLLGTLPIDQVLMDDTVRRRCDAAVAANVAYKKDLLDHTCLQGHVSISDFRGLSTAPSGNRFLVYSLFPEAVVNVKLFEDGPYVVVKLGHSIVNRGCNVNVGRLLARYGGGGHRGAGACRAEKERSGPVIGEIIDVLTRNASDES